MKTRNIFKSATIAAVLFLSLCSTSLRAQNPIQATDSLPDSTNQCNQTPDNDGSVFLVVEFDFCEYLQEAIEYNVSDESIRYQLESHPDPNFRKLATFKNKEELDSLVAKICPSK